MLYAHILEGLKQSKDFFRKDKYRSFEDYLQSLQPAVSELRTAYRRNCVDVDYSQSDIQAAYLIAYYPHYARMALAIFQRLQFGMEDTQQIQACFFGAGPCPEVVGLSLFLSEQFPQVEQLVAKIYDVASNIWAPSVEVTQYIAQALRRERELPMKLFIESSVIDLCKTQVFNQIQADIRNSTLFIVQNCLNELNEPQIFQENLCHLLEVAPLGSTIILADFRNYDRVNQIFTRTQEEIHTRDNLYLLEEGQVALPCWQPPLIITQNLLTGDNNLIPRLRVNFRFLAILKTDEYFDEEDDLFT